MKYKNMEPSNVFRKFGVLAVIFSLGSVFATQSMAQSYPNNGSYNQNDSVVVYTDCDFRGTRREVPIGEYRSLKHLKIANDSISSLEVPQGLELSLFEDDNFRGASVGINQNVRCLDQNWNDEASSLRVDYVGQAPYGQNNDAYGNRNNQDRNHQNRRPRDDRNNGGFVGHNPRPGDPRYGTNRSYAGSDAKVTGRNIVFVSFSGVALSNVGNKQWRSTNNRGQATNFRELSRENNAVYLENTNSFEKLKIDLFTDQVTTIARDGRQFSFPITSKQAALVNSNSANDRNGRVGQPGTNRRISNRCFTYKAYTRGGGAGIRFHGHEGFNRFSKTGHSARLCHDGPLTMEISKTEPRTEVVVEIDGNRYVFAANDKGDTYLNSWYRKAVKLRVGR